MQYKGYYAKTFIDEDAKLIHGEINGLRAVVTLQDVRSKRPKRRSMILSTTISTGALLAARSRKNRSPVGSM
jgi:predicted HicB family RNase H-like nuclease